MELKFAGGGMLMAFLIALSTFGTTGIYCMTAPRIYYAMAKDGIFFKKLAEVHPRWQTPVHAILIQSVWSVFLLFFWGTFEDLIEYVTFVDWIGLTLVGATIFVFRRRRPNAERGYRTLFYPVTPLIFVGISLWFIGFTLIEKPVRAWAGLFVVAVGWVVYQFYFKKKEK
jgi:basic amino acid/polyamine antiporter, APA family